MPLALVPVDYIAGQKLLPYWNGFWSTAAGSQQPGGGAQSNLYTGGPNFAGSGFGGAYLYNGALYALTADSLFTSIPSSNGPTIWKSLDSGTTWARLSNPPTSGSMDWRGGWVTAWNPASAANLITFCGYSFANLVDFNLDTLSWSTIYATNAPVAGHNRSIARLSDGRIRFIGSDDTDAHLYYSTESGGSWAWGISMTPAPFTGSFNLDQGGSCLDAANRMHVWLRYSQGASVQTTYANVDSSNTVTVQSNSPIDQTKATGAMLAADNVYIGAIGLSAANSVDVYVGAGLANPVWHAEQVAVGAFPPDHLFLRIVNGLPTLAWQEQDPAHNTPMKIRLSQRSGGAWSVPQTILDLASVQPVAPFAPTTNVWIGQGFSFASVSGSRAASGGIELIVALDITTDANGTSGTMTFSTSGTSGTGTSNLFQFPAYVLPQPCAYPIHPENKNLLTLKVPEYAFRKLRI